MFSFIANFIAEGFPSKPTWTADKTPDCSGKVFLVTGGNAGCGYKTVKALLQKGGKVYMASRSRGKANIAELERETGRRAIFLELDLASLASIKRSAKEFTSKESRVNVLFNHGGVMAVPMDLNVVVRRTIGALRSQPQVHVRTIVTRGKRLRFAHWGFYVSYSDPLLILRVSKWHDPRRPWGR